jgi:two-component system, LytTR family, response regulator
MTIDCIIVEDEPLAQERTATYVSRIPFLNLVAVFESSVEALMFTNSNPVDLIFLDINMGEFSGIQFLESLSGKNQVIITSAHHEYALRGFELEVTDYLLKPYGFDRFVQAVERARANLSHHQHSIPKEIKFIFIKTEHRLEKLLFTELLYIEGMRDYRSIHTIQKRIMTLQTFGDFENDIPRHIACRVHKSYMVALDRIESIERDQIKIRNVMIPISETYKKAFFQLINHSAK